VIIKKSPEEIEQMASAGAVLAATLDLLEGKVCAGVSTAELDKVAERFIRAHGGTPTFKGYRGFPGSICASPNAMIVHGIPGPYRLKDGDIISIDVGVTLDGWVADAARTFAVGEVGEQARNLLSATEQSLHAGVAQCRPGNRMGDVSSAIQSVAEAAGLSVVRSLVGHGVGRSMHEDPQVPNVGKPRKGPLLEAGMVLAIEPMTTAGRPGVRVGGDGWAIFSQDGSPAAHFEFTVAVTPTGPRILTPWHLPAAARGAGRARAGEAEPGGRNAADGAGHRAADGAEAVLPTAVGEIASAG
jgi:methionyl aminopeptidase